MDNHTRGQASIESMFVLGILLIVFVVLGFTVYKSYVRSVDLKMYVAGTRLANSVADKVNALNAVGDGYSTDLVLPALLQGGANYSVVFYPNESSVFVEGGGFSSGSDLRFSSPLSTSNVHCIRSECNYSCNRTESDECLQVTDRVDARLVKYGGGIYLTPKYNVLQGPNQAFISPFEGAGEADLENLSGMVHSGKDAAGRWNSIFVYHNTVNNTLSMVFSINLTNNERARMRIVEVVGKRVMELSNDGGAAPEFNMAADPQGQWVGNSTGDVDGGAVVFKGGFSACIIPEAANMPSQDWTFLSSDGVKVTLDKDTKVCVSYP